MVPLAATIALHTVTLRASALAVYCRARRAPLHARLNAPHRCAKYKFCGGGGGCCSAVATVGGDRGASILRIIRRTTFGSSVVTSVHVCVCVFIACASTPADLSMWYTRARRASTRPQPDQVATHTAWLCVEVLTASVLANTLVACIAEPAHKRLIGSVRSS